MESNEVLVTQKKFIRLAPHHKKRLKFIEADPGLFVVCASKLLEFFGRLKFKSLVEFWSEDFCLNDNKSKIRQKMTSGRKKD